MSRNVLQPQNSPDSDPDNKHKVIRAILVAATIILMFATLVVFCVTNNAIVLGTTTIFGYAVVRVFKFYF